MPDIRRVSEADLADMGALDDLETETTPPKREAKEPLPKRPQKVTPKERPHINVGGMSERHNVSDYWSVALAVLRGPGGGVEGQLPDESDEIYSRRTERARRHYGSALEKLAIYTKRDLSQPAVLEDFLISLKIELLEKALKGDANAKRQVAKLFVVDSNDKTKVAALLDGLEKEQEKNERDSEDGDADDLFDRLTTSADAALIRGLLRLAEQGDKESESKLHNIVLLVRLAVTTRDPDTKNRILLELSKTYGIKDIKPVIKVISES